MKKIACIQRTLNGSIETKQNKEKERTITIITVKNELISTNISISFTGGGHGSDIDMSELLRVTSFLILFLIFSCVFN